MKPKKRRKLRTLNRRARACVLELPPFSPIDRFWTNLAFQLLTPSGVAAAGGVLGQVRVAAEKTAEQLDAIRRAKEDASSKAPTPLERAPRARRRVVYPSRSGGDA